MTFKEQFPSLKLKIQQGTHNYPLMYSAWTMERLLEDVEKHCLDKERVREAIERWLLPTHEAIKFEKELGL